MFVFNVIELQFKCDNFQFLEAFKVIICLANI